MINLKKEKNPMPEQEPQVRATNFEEVAEGYTPQMAVNEAMRCLKCRKKPCTTGCPVMVNIPAFVEKVAESDFEAAYQIISETSALPRICGRVCPQENQCEGKCVQGVLGEPVAIGKARALPVPPPTTATRFSPSISVGLPRGPTTSSRQSPSSS